MSQEKTEVCVISVQGSTVTIKPLNPEKLQPINQRNSVLDQLAQAISIIVSGVERKPERKEIIELSLAITH